MRSIAENNRLPCSFEQPSGGFTDTKGRTDGNLWFRVKHDEKPPFEPEGTFPQGVFRDGLFDHHGVVARIPFPVVGERPERSKDDLVTGGGGNDRNLKFRLLALGKYPRQPKMETRIFNDVEPGSRVYKTLDLTVEEQRQAQLLKDVEAIRVAAEQGIAEAKAEAPVALAADREASPSLRSGVDIDYADLSRPIPGESEYVADEKHDVVSRLGTEEWDRAIALVPSDSERTVTDVDREAADREGTILKQSVIALADRFGVPLGDAERVLVAEAGPYQHQNMVRLMEEAVKHPDYNREHHRTYVRHALLDSVVPPDDNTAWQRFSEDEARAVGQILEEESVPMPTKDDVSFSMDSKTFRSLTPRERQIWVLRQLKRDVLGRAVDETGTPILAIDMAEDFLNESYVFNAASNQFVEAEDLDSSFLEEPVIGQDPGAVKEEKGFREGVLDEFTATEASLPSPVQLQGVYGIDLATGELKPGYLRYADNPANRRIGRAGKVYKRGLRLHKNP